MEDINLLLTYLETEVLDGKKSLLGGGIIINSDSVLSLIKRLRTAFSEATGENVLASANAKAQQIIAMAEARRKQILDNDTIIADAQAIADKIQMDALNDREKENKEFKAKVYNMLDKVNKNILMAEEQITKSMDYLDKELEE